MSHEGMVPAEEWAETQIHRHSRYACAKCGEEFASPLALYSHQDIVVHRDPSPEAETELPTTPPRRRTPATLAQLSEHARRYGPEQVLESARHLSEDDYEELRQLVRSLKSKAKR